jgi:(p)ppGpp synthase/HD superfamily hydrolase
MMSSQEGDPLAVLGALLHDTLEDTDTTRKELETEFGVEAAALVAEVTADKSLPKQERKRLQVELDALVKRARRRGHDLPEEFVAAVIGEALRAGTASSRP